MKRPLYMSTQIFKDYYTFLSREDKKINGVSEEFADAHPDYEKENETNEGCWNCYDCSDCSDCYYCSDCSYCSDCYYCSDCSRCSDCRGCHDCSDCYGCSRCYYCPDCSRCSDCRGCHDCSDCYGCSRCYGCYDYYRCSDCSYLENNKPKAFPEIPVIENIHQKILEVVSNPGALNMDFWHSCETTHCRAGWVIHLAGQKGYELEKRTSPVFAAQQIYKASSPIKVSPPRFYENNTKAMEDIKRCAEEEKVLPTKGDK